MDTNLVLTPWREAALSLLQTVSQCILRIHRLSSSVFFENKAVFDSRSSTGFSKWNADTQEMEPYEHTIDRAEQITASVNELSESKMAELMAEYAVVKVHMWNGNWTRNIYIPTASADNRGSILTINHEAGYNSYLFINGDEKVVSQGYKRALFPMVSSGKNVMWLILVKRVSQSSLVFL